MVLLNSPHHCEGCGQYDKMLLMYCVLLIAVIMVTVSHKFLEELLVGKECNP